MAMMYQGEVVAAIDSAQKNFSIGDGIMWSSRIEIERTYLARNQGGNYRNLFLPTEDITNSPQINLSSFPKPRYAYYYTHHVIDSLSQ
jgi:hypothetical protein